MRIRTVLASANLLILAGVPSIAQAQQLWNNGSFDGIDALVSLRNGAFADSRVYDNFVVASGSGWTVTSLFGEFLTNFDASEAYWEIRSGVSTGLGGTLVNSGTTSIAGVTELGDAFGFDHRLYIVSGFAPIFLWPGEYWLTIAPIAGGFGSAFIATTSGTGAVNALGDQAAFWDSPESGMTFVDASDLVGATDFSYGINGISTATVPEPSTVVLVGTGIGLLALRSLRRRRNG